MCKLNSQQSSDPIFFCTNTRTHTRQNKSYRLGAVPAGVVGARGRCCPAATVPVAVAFACCVCCCRLLLTKSKIKSSTEKQSSAMIVHKAKRTAVTSTRTTHTRQNNPYRLGVAPAGGARGRCCPALTVPAAVVIARVVCCIAQKSKTTTTTTTTSSDGAWRRLRRARSYLHSRRANRGSR